MYVNVRLPPESAVAMMYGSVILIHGFPMVASCFTQTSKMHANIG
jgi:hypothetical protein